MPAGRPANNRYPFLDAVRGLASLAVVFFHISVSDQLPAVEGGAAGFVWNTLFANGSLGVAVFFVLSGFVIAHSLRRGLETASSLGRFMFRRLVRLTPPYWAAIVFAVAFHSLAVYVNGEDFAPGGQALSAPRLLHHIFYTQEIAGYANINDVFWTLALELQFYIALGALAVLLTHLSHLFKTDAQEYGAWLLACGSLVFAFFDSDLERATTLPPIFYSFVMGVLVNWYWQSRIHVSSLVVFFVGIAALSFISSDTGFVRTVFVSGLVLVVALKTGWIYYSWRPLDFLGRVSYSLYLVHVPIVGASLLIVTKALGTGAAGIWIGTIAAVVASLVASTGFWWLVERPSMSWLASRRRPAPAKPAFA